jgi:hypothetical protein
VTADHDIHGEMQTAVRCLGRFAQDIALDVEAQRDCQLIIDTADTLYERLKDARAAAPSSGSSDRARGMTASLGAFALPNFPQEPAS